MKPELRQKARELRIQGLSIKQIVKELQVSQSSVSGWVRDIILSVEQIEQLKQRNPSVNKQLNGAQKRSDLARQQRLQYQEEGKNKAKEKDLLHQAGCMLYWAEGNKSKNGCALINSDVNLLKLFIKFLRKIFKLTKDDFVITINYYTNNGLTKNDIENYWLMNLELDKSAMRKGQENNRPRSATHAVRHNKLPYGMCCLKVKKSTYIVQHIYGAIQEYAEFDNQYMLK